MAGRPMFYTDSLLLSHIVVQNVASHIVAEISRSFTEKVNINLEAYVAPTSVYIIIQMLR